MVWMMSVRGSYGTLQIGKHQKSCRFAEYREIFPTNAESRINLLLTFQFVSAVRNGPTHTAIPPI